MSTNKLLLNLEDYVRVINTTGKTIEGRYDGVDYEFPDAQQSRDAGAQEYRDVHKAVAMHMFGFCLPETADPPYQDKTACLFRLGWLTSDSSSIKLALAKLRSGIQFHPIPQFPTSVVEFKRDESVARVPSPTMGQGEVISGPAPEVVSPKDPFQKTKNTLAGSK